MLAGVDEVERREFGLGADFQHARRLDLGKRIVGEGRAANNENASPKPSAHLQKSRFLIYPPSSMWGACPD